MRTKATEDKAYWAKHIENCKASGLNKHKYCKQHNITYHRFLYWHNKLATQPLQPRSANKNTSKANQFIKVKLDSEHASAFNQACSTTPLCVLELKQGHRLLVHNEVALEKLFLLLGE